MSKRTERRAAERIARKAAFQQLRQKPPQTAPAEPQIPIAEPEAVAPGISAAQLAANRANAQHSTGATTPEGKARSAMNALKHGLSGKTVVLPYEDADQYQRELDHCTEHYKPGTEEELRLTQLIQDCLWRISRVQRLQTGILLKGHIEFEDKYSDRSPQERAQLIGAEGYLKYEKQLRNLDLQEARLLRTMEKAVAELKRLKAIRQRQEMTGLEVTREAEKFVQPLKNGFEFATCKTIPSTTAEPLKKQAA